jgi:esterase/lipase superfamily enzyme
LVVRIFYGTDRAITGDAAPERYFANDRSGDGRVTLGVCDVRIPSSDEHSIGELERPRFWKFEFVEDPSKHVILQRVLQMDDVEFFMSLAQRVASSAAREAFVFVHGYNLTFADAARRAAQLAYDLKFDGAPILYSWPSRGVWWRYPADEDVMDWSEPHLESFLSRIASSSGARTVHVIAHSMGNRVLTKALSRGTKKFLRSELCG